MSELEPSNIIFADFEAPRTGHRQKIQSDFELEAEALAKSFSEPFMVENPYFYLLAEQPIEDLKANNKKEFDNVMPDSADAWREVLFPDSDHEARVIDFDLVNHELIKEKISVNGVVVKFSVPIKDLRYQYYEIPLVDILPIFKDQGSKFADDLTLEEFFMSDPELLNQLHRFMFLLKNGRTNNEESKFYTLVDERDEGSNARVFRYSVKYS